MAQAYPTIRWNRVARAEVGRVDRLLSLLSDEVLAHAEVEALRLLGLPGEAQLLGASHTTSSPRSACAITLRRDDGLEMTICVAPSLAAFAVDRVLGGEGTIGSATAMALGPAQEGVLLYVATRLLPPKSQWSVAACRFVQQERRDHVADGQQAPSDALTLSGRLTLGSALGWFTICTGAGVTADTRGKITPTARSWARSLTAAQRSWSVPLTAEAAVATFSRSAIAEWGPGDFVFFSPCWLRSLKPLQGDVRLRIPAGTRGCWHFSLADGKLSFEEALLQPDAPLPLVLKTASMPQDPKDRSEPAADEAASADESRGRRTERILGEAPVELSLELARFSLPLERLLRLAPGEVLTTRVAIGETVALRTNDRVVASGELVEVDGEIGVRISELH